MKNVSLPYEFKDGDTVKAEVKKGEIEFLRSKLLIITSQFYIYCFGYQSTTLKLFTMSRY